MKIWAAVTPGESNDLSTDGQIYDPGTGSGTPSRTMNARRGGHVAIRLTDGRVLMVGGEVSVDGGDGSIVLSDPAAEVFDLHGGG